MSAQEVRITTAGKVQNYVGYVLSVLDPGHEHDPVGRSCGCGMVQLRAAGPAVNKAVTVAEIVKRRLDGLHQVTTAALQVNEALPLHADQSQPHGTAQAHEQEQNARAARVEGAGEDGSSNFVSAFFSRLFKGIGKMMPAIRTAIGLTQVLGGM